MSPKPFHLEDGVARIRAIDATSGACKKRASLRAGALDTRTAGTVDGQYVYKLTSNEYRL